MIHFTPKTLFYALPGQWDLTRHIPEHDCTATGVAKISYLEKTKLLYEENGVLRILSTQKKYPFTKQYFFTLNKEATKISVYFDEDLKQLFHTLKFNRQNNSLCATEHLCGCDVYKTSYQFSNAHAFSIRHEVLGPKKKYTSETRFFRKPTNCH